MSSVETDNGKLGVQVIARAAAILRALKDQKDGLSLGQIAERVGLPRSTVQRIVGALQDQRLVIAAQPGRGIRLGPELHSLAESARIDMVEMLHPYLTELGRRTGETIDLAVLRNDHLVFIDQIPSRHRLRTVSSVGETFPLTTTANGKACLARMNDDAVLAALRREQPEAAADPQRSAAFVDEIAAVRRAGVAFDLDQHTAGVSAVGVAFRGPAGSLYAISVPVPSSRFAKSAAAVEDELRATLADLERMFSPGAA